MFGNWTSTDLRAAALKHEEMARKYRDLADVLDETKQLVTQELPYKTRERRKNFRTREIINFLQKQRSASASEIQDECRIPLQTVYWVCKRLLEKGKIFKNEDDRWSLVETDQDSSALPAPSI